MKFFTDENVARSIVQWLRQTGHDVLYAAEAHPGQIVNERSVMPREKLYKLFGCRIVNGKTTRNLHTKAAILMVVECTRKSQRGTRPRRPLVSE